MSYAAKAAQLRNSYTYDIWGNILTSSETVENPLRYSGEYWDDTTELQYLRARWYDPSIGRFLQEDMYQGELTNPLMLNLYTYVHNNPLKYIDPSGYVVFLVHGTWSDNTTWTEKNDNMVPYLEELFNEDIYFREWTGNNSVKARQKGADDLVQQIVDWRNIKGNIYIKNKSNFTISGG